jgi:hypothetical protein
MAITVSALTFDIAGVTTVVKGSLAFDSSYATGGTSLTAVNVGLRVIDQIRIDPKSGYVFEYNDTTQKVMVYRSAGFTPSGTVGAPTFSGSALGTHTHSIPAGTDAGGGTSGETSGGTPAGTNSAPAFTGAAVAATTLVEVANGVDLSALTGVRFRAEGA